MPDNYDAIIQEVRRLRDRVSALERGTMRIPFLNSDPSADDATNIWGFNDGRIKVRLPSGTVKQISTATNGAVDSATPNPARTQKDTYDRTLTSDWEAGYSEAGDLISNQTGMPFGFKDNLYGRQTVIIGFTSWAAELVGADIKVVYLTTEMADASLDSGVIGYFGTHEHLSVPATYAYTSRLNFMARLPKAGTKTVKIDKSFGEGLRDGLITGFVIDQLTSSIKDFGVSTGRSRLRIVYTK